MSATPEVTVIACPVCETAVKVWSDDEDAIVCPECGEELSESEPDFEGIAEARAEARWGGYRDAVEWGGVAGW